MKKIRAWIIMGAACMAVILSLPEDYGAVMSYAGAGLMRFCVNLIPCVPVCGTDGRVG